MYRVKKVKINNKTQLKIQLLSITLDFKHGQAFSILVCFTKKSTHLKHHFDSLQRIHFHC